MGTERLTGMRGRSILLAGFTLAATAAIAVLAVTAAFALALSAPAEALADNPVGGGSDEFAAAEMTAADTTDAIWDASVSDVNIHYQLDSSGAAVITGYDKSATLTYLRLPSKVPGKNIDIKSVKAKAFESCSTLTELSFAAGLETIGDESFAFCTGLVGKTITIPSSVTSIGSGAFYFSDSYNSSAGETTMVFEGWTMPFPTISEPDNLSGAFKLNNVLYADPFGKYAANPITVKAPTSADGSASALFTLYHEGYECPASGDTWKKVDSVTLSRPYGTKKYTLSSSDPNVVENGIFVVVDGNGTVSGEPDYYYANQPVTLTATPGSSSVDFYGWTVDGPKAEPLVLSLSGSAMPSASQLYSTDPTITLTPTGPDGRYSAKAWFRKFQGLWINGYPSGRYPDAAAGDDLKVEGGTIVGGGKSYATNSTATLVAVPDKGWELKEWKTLSISNVVESDSNATQGAQDEDQGASDSNMTAQNVPSYDPFGYTYYYKDTLSFSVSYNSSVTATFQKKATTAEDVTVSLPTSLTGGSVTANAASFQVGDTVILTATPDANFTFGSWQVSGDFSDFKDADTVDGLTAQSSSVTSSKPVISFTALGDVTVSASFSPVVDKHDLRVALDQWFAAEFDGNPVLVPVASGVGQDRIAVSSDGSGLAAGTSYVSSNDVAAMKSAYEAAYAVYSSASASQQEVDAAVGAFQAAVTTFRAAVKTASGSAGDLVTVVICGYPPFSNPFKVGDDLKLAGGTIVGGGKSYSVGDTVTLTAVPDSGYALEKWTLSGSFDIVDSGIAKAAEDLSVQAALVGQTAEYTSTEPTITFIPRGEMTLDVAFVQASDGTDGNGEGDGNGVVGQKDQPAKKSQTLKAKTRTQTVKSSKIAKKAYTFKMAKAAKLTGAKTAVSYTKAKATIGKKGKKSAKKWVKVSKKGVVTVKKGTPKGYYKLVVTAKAKATSAYKASNAKKITLYIRVK